MITSNGPFAQVNYQESAYDATQGQSVRLQLVLSQKAPLDNNRDDSIS